VTEAEKAVSVFVPDMRQFPDGHTLTIEPNTLTESTNPGDCLAALFRIEFTFPPGQRSNRPLSEFVR
jgi:hypothetical protein